MEPAGYPMADAMQRCIDEIYEKTDGRVDIKLYPGTILGSAEAINEMVMMGDVEFALEPIYDTWDPRLIVGSYFPYMVTSYDEFRDLMGYGGGFFNLIDGLARPLGYRPLGIYCKGFMGLTLHEMPEGYADPDVAKDVKIRTSACKANRLVYERLGYKTTTIDYAEIYSAISTGIVEGQMGGGYEQATLFKDINKVLILYKDGCEMNYWLVNNEAFDKLSSEDQQVLLDAIAHQNELRYDEIDESEAGCAKELVEDWGWEIVKLTPEEMAKCSDAIRTDVWPQMEKIVGKEIMYKAYDAIGMPELKK